MQLDLDRHYLIEHPMDVLAAACEFLGRNERIALAIITGTEGGAVRARGAMMAISESGHSVGYLSGGCIDQDVVAQGLSAIESGTIRKLRYGSGSPFLDIQLPCGGAIDLAVVPCSETQVIRSILYDLKSRTPARYVISDNGLSRQTRLSGRSEEFVLLPKLQVRISGKGHEPVALAKLAHACGISTSVWTPDDECAALSKEIAFSDVTRLKVPGELPDISDDAYTAFVLMFHDREWETALLQQALTGNAFYIGALGSRATHARRIKALEARGILPNEIARIRAPIGLIPSMRDASMLAVSTLAEIVSEFSKTAVKT